MVEEKKSKKPTHKEPEDYCHASLDQEFDPSRLETLTQELKGTLKRIVLFPNQDFTAAFDTLAIEIPEQIKTTLEKIDEVRKENPTVGEAMREKYLQAVEAVLTEFNYSYKMLYFLSLLFLPAFIGMTIKTVTRPDVVEILKNPGTALAYLVTFMVLGGFNVRSLSPLLKRTFNAKNYILNTFASVQTRIAKDLVILEAGGIPPRYSDLLQGMFKGQVETNEMSFLTQDQSTLAADNLQAVPSPAHTEELSEALKSRKQQ